MNSPTPPSARILVDCDAGIDDALALLLLCSQAGGSLQAVTCLAGNTGLDCVTCNVLLALDQACQDVPVYAGCSSPLAGGGEPAAGIMGPDGLGGATQHLPPSERKVQPGHAALAILDASRGPQPLTILALGPLTNLALAAGLDSSLPNRVERLVVMGGAVRAQGNASPAAEFNFFYDPEAAHAVLHAGFRDILLVPWETCVDAALPWADYEAVCRGEGRLGRFFRLVTGELAGILGGQFDLPGLVLPDVLAAALALDESIGVDIRPAAVDVVLHQGPGRGFMPVDWQGVQGNRSSVRLVMDVDKTKYHALIAQVFGKQD